MSNIVEKLRQASEILKSSGIAEARREAVSLLAFALGKDKIFLVAHSEYSLSTEENKRFDEFLKRRAMREPLQYITGRQEFFGLDFAVTKDVLIPRPETELLVESAIGILRDWENPRFCEIGVGSGCIGISILHELKSARAVGLDISKNALEIARKNAAAHSVLIRLDLKISDVYENSGAEKFDLIASNPPYIALEEVKNLQAEVRDYEPICALTDNFNGLSIIEKIILGAPEFLKSDGFLLLEIGFGQANKVREMFSARIWRDVEILPDLQGIPRTVKARKLKSKD